MSKERGVGGGGCKEVKQDRKREVSTDRRRGKARIAESASWFSG